MRGAEQLFVLVILGRVRRKGNARSTAEGLRLMILLADLDLLSFVVVVVVVVVAA